VPRTLLAEERPEFRIPCVHDLRFEGHPTISQGYVEWRVVNKDTEAARRTNR
jgi:hypothetical protein